MTQLRLTVQTITPLLMYGADNKDDRATGAEAVPELRASSVRGILRYWLRAVLGAQYTTTSQVFEAESAILGSTGGGSKVRVRVQRSRTMEAEPKQIVLPEQTSSGYKPRYMAYPPDSEFRITLSTHPLDKSGVLSSGSDLIKAVFLMTHMSGLGRRSRRGSGNLRVLGAKGYEDKPTLNKLPKDREDLRTHLQDISHFVSDPRTTIGRRPNFPVFAYDTAVVLLGKETHRDYEGAFDELWRVSGSYHHDGGIFGDIRPRRVSAIHMRVAATAAGYVAQQTILYSGNGNWSRMQQYINDCRSNGFDDIYGTWGHWR